MAGQQLLDGGDDSFGLRQGRVFEVFGVRDRDFLTLQTRATGASRS